MENTTVKELTDDKVAESTPLETSNSTAESFTEGKVHYAQEDGPDGGALGWICVCSRFFINLISFGIIYSFGVLYVELFDVFTTSRGDVAWVGSLASGAMYMSGPLSNVLVRRYSCRTTTIIAGFVASVGFAASSFATSLVYLYCSFGVVVGLGLGLPIIPSVLIVTYYFEKRRSTAMSVAAVGAGVGTLCFPPLFTFLLERYGWRGLMLVLSGLSLNIVVCGAVYRPPKYWENREREPRDHDRAKFRAINSSNSPPKYATVQILFHRPFAVYITFVALVHLVFAVPYVHVPDMARVRGDISKHRAASLISVMGMAGVVARLAFGFLSDLSPGFRPFLHASMLLVCGVAALLCTCIQSYTLFAVYSAIHGAFIGGWTAVLPVVLTDLVGVHQTGNALGIHIFLSGLALTVASPIAGSLFDLTGSYVIAFYLAGIIFLIGGTAHCCLFVYIMRTRKHK